jgi:tetratricopeptide (TPR) repeat protein
MENLNNTLLSNQMPLSRCGLWEAQRQYYAKQGIKAWAQVPFYATSNPYIAASYANILIRYWQDLLQQNRVDSLQPFYVLELGAGHGIFSFYVLQRLSYLCEQLKLPKQCFKYIISDFTQLNIDYWHKHPAFQPYIASKMVDFALVDIEDSESLHLQLAKKTLRKGSLANPLVVIANYVFDTVRQDIFQIQDGVLQQGLLSFTMPQSATGDEYFDLSQLSWDINFTPIDLPYYGNPVLDSILQTYCQQFKQAQFLLPVGAIRCLQLLGELTRASLFVLSTDKAYLEDYEFINQSGLPLVLHGKHSFSLTVNFHALGLWAKLAQGDYYRQMDRKSVASAAFLWGDTLNNLPETHLALTTYLDNFSPGDILNLYLHIHQQPSLCSLPSLIALLNLTSWDPHIFNLYSNNIFKLLNSANPNEREAFKRGLEKIAASYYELPIAPNTLLNIALCLQFLEDYRSAIVFYEKAIESTGEQEASLYNIGLCYYHLQQRHKARSYFDKTLALNPTHLLAKQWSANLS